MQEKAQPSYLHRSIILDSVEGRDPVAHTYRGTCPSKTLFCCSSCFVVVVLVML